jgi:hypothetical protein
MATTNTCSNIWDGRSNFNLAERNALKVLYNEEDILITIFNNMELIPPSATGVLFEEEHATLKAIIDGTPT